MKLLFALPIILLPYSLYLPPDIGVGVSALLLLWAIMFGPRDPQPVPRRSYLLPPLAGLGAAFALGYFIALGHDASTPGKDALQAKYALTYPLLYLAYRHCGVDTRSTGQLIMLTLAIAAIAGLHALLQGLQFNPDQFVDAQRATGPFGAVGAANRAGVFFAMFLPLFAALALEPQCHRMLRLFALAAGTLLVAGILFTFSRQAYVIAAVGIAILLFNRSFTVAALALAVAAVIGAGLLPEGVMQRIDETRQIGAGGAVYLDASTASRFEIWKGAFAMLADHPTGVGLGRFRELIGQYTAYPGMDAHNGFLRVLVECGPLALAMMLWLAWRLWMLARKMQAASRNGSPMARALATGLGVAVISMVAGNFFGSPYFDGLVMYNFWILCGLLERHAVLQAYTGGAHASEPPLPHALGMATRFPAAARAFPGLTTDGRMGPRAGK